MVYEGNLNRLGQASRRRRLRGFVYATIALAIAGAALAPKFGRENLDDASTSVVPPLERIGLRPSTVSVDAHEDTLTTPRVPFEPRVPSALADATSTARLDATPAYPTDRWRSVSVAPGDNLSLIFARVGASRADLAAVLDTDKRTQAELTALNPGQMFRFRIEDGKLMEVVYERDFLTAIHCVRASDGSGYRAEWRESEPEIRLASAVAQVNHSLFIDGQKAGLTDKTIMEFINVFGWDVDFLHDLQRGDRFSLIFEELYKDGQKFTTGKILAAEFITGGKKLRAVYYKNSSGIEGYYSDTGSAMRKAFLRTPVNFTRISSRFSLARQHPILNRIRAHKGVDYAAPMGTPVRSVADGRAEYVGWQNGYGRVIVLKHGDTYSTLYGHLSGFARGLTTGTRISQGQTIGYVGKSGLATGPHLHYEFRVNGVHRDPLAIKLPNALPLEQRYLADFKNHAAPLLSKLDEVDTAPAREQRAKTMLARRDTKRSGSPTYAN